MKSIQLGADLVLVHGLNGECVKGGGKFKEIKDNKITGYSCLLLFVCLFLIEKLEQKAHSTILSSSFLNMIFFSFRKEMSDRLLCLINPSGINCPLVRGSSPAMKLYLQTTYFSLSLI